MPVSKIVSNLLRLLLVVLVSAPFMLLLLAIQSQPTVEESTPLSAAELTEIEELILESAPTSTARASQQQVTLNRNELNLLLRYGLQIVSLAPAWAGRLDLEQESLSIDLSIPISGDRLPLYLNVQGRFTESDGILDLSELRLGNFTLPQSLQRYAVARLRNNLLATETGFQEFSDLADNVEQVDILPNALTMNMLWEPSLIDRIASRTRQLFVPEYERLRIIAYYEQIRDIVATIPTDLRAVSLNTFLVPLFNRAHELSLQGNDPVVENRAAFQALAIYVNNEDLGQLLGPEFSAGIEPVEFIEVRLQRRQDLAQHLTSIAATTSSAGAGFAQLLSTTKEAYDARYRSGFSFSDLTANSVGVTLATFATESEASALAMQLRLSAIENEADYMPEVGNNRDGLSESDFATLYTDRNSREYEQRIAEIQSLIMERPLFQGLD
ncbi:MAG: hypothetical protein MI746_06390 [Pseudomonadales bacterium]|nr:hypothetical protein [Pseudomonadales bacterium]